MYVESTYICGRRRYHTLLTSAGALAPVGPQWTRVDSKSYLPALTTTYNGGLFASTHTSVGNKGTYINKDYIIDNRHTTYITNSN
jgi:hypothetical protein